VRNGAAPNGPQEHGDAGRVGDQVQTHRLYERSHQQKYFKAKIFTSILISSEPTAAMVVKIWIFGGPLTQSVTVANHI
jgi:hypothetical protein